MKPEQERVKDLIKDTVLLLCKNGLSYIDELRIEGVIGVTLDNKDLFLVHVNEKLNTINEIVDDKSSQDGSRVKDCDEGRNPQTHTGQSEVSNTRLPEEPLPCASQKTGTYVCETGGNGNSSTIIKIEDDDEIIKKDECFNQQQSHFTAHPHRMPNKRPHTSTPQQTQPHSMRNLPISGTDLELCEPDPKQFVQDQDLSDTFRLGFGGGSSIEPQVWSQLGEFASQQAALDTSTSFNALGPCPPLNPGGSRGIASDGSSGPPQEAKYPSHALQSHNIKEALAFGVVDPLMDTEPRGKVITFRLSWFGTDSSLLDRVWQNIVSLQEQMDQFIGNAPGVKVLISAYTGTLSGRTTKTDNPGVRMTYPGLAYWIMCDSEQINEQLFMRQLHESALGARIKSLLYEFDQTKEKVTNALFVVLKDCTGGFVRRKVDESLALCPDREGRQRTALVRIWVKDEEYWTKMRAAQDRLKSACCDVSLHRL